MAEMKPSPLPVGLAPKSAYVPPSRRSTTAPAAPQLPENVDLNNASAFPTLVPSAIPKKAWAATGGGGGSFTQKIHEWIAFDRMTAVERARAAEKARELEGWETLTIKKMPELGIEFNTNLLMVEYFAKSIDGLNELGLHFQKTKSVYRSYDDDAPTPAIHEEPTPPSFIEDSVTDDEEEDN
jgi:hypothetical protein